MVNWIFIFALLVVGLLLAKVKHLKHKSLAVFLALIVLFFCLTVPPAVKNSDVNFKTFSGVAETFKLYFVWLGHSFGNVKTLTGNAIKMDWVGNQSDIKK